MKALARAAVLALTAALAACAGAPKVGDPAPEAAARDLEGRSVRLSDLRGYVTLVDFWATWCEPCKDTIPLYEKLYAERSKDRFVVVGVSEDEPSVDLKSFVEKKGMTYPVWRDDKYAVYNAFGAFQLPAAFLLDRNGRLVRRWDGFTPVNASEIEAEIEKETRK